MTEQTTTATAIIQPAQDKPVAAPRVTFAPQISVHLVATLTLGRQTFNDSDKANYFEG
ncbi:hypothetical protein ABZ622_16240 [Streptomyces sp. NPDC007164]|uniref:hypothetical protein n=1 Tax=Streptomyces sp. NPDC007164 TaxID=3156918 RepID=UPI0033F55287